jgi:hypothetical protein
MQVELSVPHAAEAPPHCVAPQTAKVSCSAHNATCSAPQQCVSTSPPHSAG